MPSFPIFATAQATINAMHTLKIVGPVLYAEPNVVATEKGDPGVGRHGDAHVQ